MLSEAQKRDVVSRLNRVEGQIRGIRRMIEEPRRCIDIVQQLSAAEAALAKISHLILKLHLEQCVPLAITKGRPHQRRGLQELADIVGRFVR